MCVVQGRILNYSQQWAVLDKPAGVPAVPTVDNILENCLAFAAQVWLSHWPHLSMATFPEPWSEHSLLHSLLHT